MIETMWLAVILAVLWAWTVHGNRQYAAFRSLTDTQARIAGYRRWTVESFVLLTGASAITLLILGATGAPFARPDAFAVLAGHLSHRAEVSGDGTIGFAIGMAAGLAVLAALHLYRLKRVVDAITADIEPLLPRTLGERLNVIPLCLNAGFSEELFFRLALPLLATEVTGSAIIGFVLATVAFGLMHVYQGWKGVLGTTLLGALFSFHYLQHGSLLWVMGAHAAINLIGLIVRPLIAGRIVSRRRP